MRSVDSAPRPKTCPTLPISGPHSSLLLTTILLLQLASSSVAEQAYPLGCSEQPQSYYDYDNYPFPPPGISIKTTDSFHLLRRLGSGKFSDVFEAVNVDKEKMLRQQQHQQGSSSARGGMLLNSSGNNNDEDATTSPSAPIVDPRTLAVLKCLKPVSDRKIRRELLVLSHCWRLPNLVKLLGVVIPAATHHQQQPTMPSLVLQHAGVHSQWLCHGRGVDPTSIVTSCADAKEEQIQQSKSVFLTEYEIKYYLCHLLVALDALHAAGIMHRDVKPRNVLINKQQKDINDESSIFQHHQEEQPLLLIDLGLADMYLPHTKYNVRVASRHYKSPELLVGYGYYDYAIDVWGVGCILAGLLLRREPFFRGRDNLDQLGKIIGVLGTSDLLSYMTKYKVDLKPELRKVIAKYVVRGGHKKAWMDLILPECPVPSDEGLDLLDKLLVYDHAERLTAKQAMGHAFFDSVRERVKTDVARLFPNYFSCSSTTSASGGAGTFGTTDRGSSNNDISQHGSSSFFSPSTGTTSQPPASASSSPPTGTTNNRPIPNSSWT
jgi:casein kinase II subunit alpha